MLSRPTTLPVMCVLLRLRIATPPDWVCVVRLLVAVFFFAADFLGIQVSFVHGWHRLSRMSLIFLILFSGIRLFPRHPCTKDSKDTVRGIMAPFYTEQHQERVNESSRQSGGRHRRLTRNRAGDCH